MGSETLELSAWYFATKMLETAGLQAAATEGRPHSVGKRLHKASLRLRHPHADAG